MASVVLKFRRLMLENETYPIWTYATVGLYVREIYLVQEYKWWMSCNVTVVKYFVTQACELLINLGSAFFHRLELVGKRQISFPFCNQEKKEEERVGRKMWKESLVLSSRFSTRGKTSCHKKCHLYSTFARIVRNWRKISRQRRLKYLFFCLAPSVSDVSKKLDCS